MVTTNFQLIRYCNLLNIPLDFIGDIDHLKTIPKSKKIKRYIILLGDDGGHWVCVIRHNDDCIYFDSFGVPPCDRIIRLINHRFWYSDNDIQPLNSSNCGLFVIDFLNSVRKVNKGEFDRFLSKYNDY